MVTANSMKTSQLFQEMTMGEGVAHRDIHMHRDRKMHIYLAVITELITSCFFAGPFNTAVSTAEVISVRIWKDAIK
jgi:hypothetical protein